MEKYLWRGIVMLLIIQVFCFKTDAQEDKFRAIFIYNFTKYIEWPPNTNPDFKIIIVGKNTIEQELKAIASKMKVGSRPIVVKTVMGINEISDAEIIYVPSKNSEMDALTTKAKTINGLLVCNSPNSCQQGACINFIMKSGNLSYEISNKNIKSNGLQVNSSLLALGTLVD